MQHTAHFFSPVKIYVEKNKAGNFVIGAGSGVEAKIFRYRRSELEE
jgi:hypothetical protein